MGGHGVNSAALPASLVQAPMGSAQAGGAATSGEIGRAVAELYKNEQAQ